MELKWVGPYIIHQSLTNGTHKLQNDSSFLKKAVNGARLKIYTSPSNVSLYDLPPFKLSHEHLNDLINGEWIHIEVYPVAILIYLEMLFSLYL